MSFETVKRIKAGDLDVAYREEGSGDPIVLVHGWPLSSLTWRKVVPGLSSDARCIALDLLGAGESLGDPERDHSLGAQSKLVEAFADALGLERFTLVGHDSGGSIARGFAVANPGRVPRLVLADTEVPGHRPFFVTFLQRLEKLPGASLLMRSTFRSRGLARSPLGFGLCFGNLKKYDFEEFFRTLIVPNARSDQALRSTMKFMHDFDFDEVDSGQALYSELKMPKYVMWGEEDKIFPLEQAWRLLGMLPEPTRFDMFARAGLFVHEEKPEAWVSAMKSFLKYTPLK